MKIVNKRRISSAKKEVIIKKEQFDFKPKINEKSR